MSRHFSSVFVKLFGILLLAVLGINLAIILFLGAIRQHHIRPALVPHIARYMGYLAAELGDPPDPARAEALAAATNMAIHYESPSLAWSTAPDAKYPVREQLGHLTRIDERIEMGYCQVNPVIFVQTDRGRLVFYMSGHTDIDHRITIFGLILLAGVTLWLIGVHFLIRRILKPLRWLKTGVDQAAKGDLSHRVPEKGGGELGDLSRAFNTMTQRLDQLLKAKERLLLDVSHELRTPMTRVKVALAMLPDSSGKASILEDIAEMEAKIAELLDTARTIGVKAELRRRPTDLADLIRKAAASFARRPPGIDFAEPEPLAPVPVDPVQMEKVLKNIMDNGLKYSSTQSQPLRISLSKQDNCACIAVSDQGVGIPAEDLAFVFEPFYRVDPSRSPGAGGYGLGLSLAKTIVDAHDGRIEIQSEPGRGTTARVFLPLVVQEG